MTEVAGPSASVRLQIRVQPRATRTRIVGWNGETLKVHVHAPAVEGAANAALIDLLAAILAVPRRSIRIVNGATSRTKLVEIQGTDSVTCTQRVEAATARPR